LGAAFHGGLWNAQGITSSTAAANTQHLTALGIILNDNGSGVPIYNTFDGQAVDVNSILVKYTYYGDANLDGVVNGADYALMNTGLSGWRNGDFNYDGAINATDFALIDNAFNFQGGPLAFGELGSLSSLPTVPEPSSALLFLLGAAATACQSVRANTSRRGCRL
jgi:hypothetical protein